MTDEEIKSLLRQSYEIVKMKYTRHG
jgi:predicted DNA-binding protein (MmcQ/YjbR family)